MMGKATPVHVKLRILRAFDALDPPTVKDVAKRFNLSKDVIQRTLNAHKRSTPSNDLPTADGK